MAVDEAPKELQHDDDSLNLGHLALRPSQRGGGGDGRGLRWLVAALWWLARSNVIRKKSNVDGAEERSCECCLWLLAMSVYVISV